jgi:hypothetical protein
MLLEIILIVLIGIAALAVTIWFIVRQFRAKNACDFCPYSDTCEEEKKIKSRK